MASPSNRGHPPAPWWAGPLQGAGAAFTALQRGMQQLGEAAQRPGGGAAALPPSPPPLAAQSSLAAGGIGAPVPHAAGSSATPGIQGAGPPTVSPLPRGMPHPVTKEELGRATWTLLHTLAAQYPEHPTRRQQHDARALVDALTRIYPCAECAGHFAELVR